MKNNLVSISLALGTLVLSAISHGKPSREVATESQEVKQQSETKQKEAYKVLDWNVLSTNLTSMREDERCAAMKSLETSGFSAADRRAYVELMRKIVPQAEQADALRHIVSKVPPTSDYAQITALLGGIQATPEERKVAMRAAGGRQLKEIATTRKVTQQDLDTMRLWLKKQDPIAVDRLTGEALGEALAELPVESEAGNVNFTNAYMMLVEYPKNKSTDELISGFIKVVTEHKTDLRAHCIIGCIQDPILRKEADDRLIKSNGVPFWAR